MTSPKLQKFQQIIGSIFLHLFRKFQMRKINSLMNKIKIELNMFDVVNIYEGINHIIQNKKLIYCFKGI